MSYVKTTWYLARCLDCRPMVVMPFLSAEDRDGWVTEHEAMGHRVPRGMQEHWVAVPVEIQWRS